MKKIVDLFQVLQHFLLPRREIHRRFHHHVAEQVAVSVAAHALDALAA
jgi:hypothetical protein